MMRMILFLTPETKRTVKQHFPQSFYFTSLLSLACGQSQELKTHGQVENYYTLFGFYRIHAWVGAYKHVLIFTVMQYNLTWKLFYFHPRNSTQRLGDSSVFGHLDQVDGADHGVLMRFNLLIASHPQTVSSMSVDEQLSVFLLSSAGKNTSAGIFLCSPS